MLAAAPTIHRRHGRISNLSKIARIAKVELLTANFRPEISNLDAAVRVELGPTFLDFKSEWASSIDALVDKGLHNPPTL